MASSNTTVKQWVVTGKDRGFDGLELKDAPLPKLGDNDVLVKLEAASLNYRDLIIPLVRLGRKVPPSPG